MTDSFGAILARRRRAAALTQYGLAKKAGLSPIHVARLEAGRQLPSLETVKKLAAALGVSLAVFDELKEAGNG